MAGVIYPSQIKTNKDKLFACYSLIEQMRLEHNKTVTLARGDWAKYETKFRSYAQQSKALLNQLLAEQNQLMENIRWANYTPKQWEAVSKLSIEEQELIYQTLFGDKTAECVKPTLMTSSELNELKTIDINKLSPVLGVDPTEDFTTYTLSQEGTAVSKTADRITFTTAETRSDKFYVYKDKGVGHFNGNFTHLEKILASASLHSAAFFFWLLANAVGDAGQLVGASESFLAVYWYSNNTPVHYLYLREQDGANIYQVSYTPPALSTVYYLTVERDEAIGTYGTLYCYICTGNYYGLGGTLISTLSQALHTSKKDFRYIYGLTGYDVDEVGDTATGYVELLDLQEGQSYTRSYTALLGLLPIKSRTVSLSRSKTGLLGLSPTKSRILSLNRTKTGLLGLTPAKSRTLSLSRIKTGLLGLLPAAVSEVTKKSITVYPKGRSDLGIPISGETYVNSLCPISGGIVIGGTSYNGHVIRSTDYGDTWTDKGQPVTGEVEVREICYGDNVLLAGTGHHGHIIKSTDNGLTWTDKGVLIAGETNISGICYCGNGIFVAGTYPNCHAARSINYGETWTDLGQMVSGQKYFLPSYFGGGLCWAGTEDQAPYGADCYLLKSTDYGATWTNIGQQSGVKFIWHLRNLGNGIYIGATGYTAKIIRSTNYGDSWSLISTISGQYEIWGLDYCPSTGICVGGTYPTGYLIKSTDKGATWTNWGVPVSGETTIWGMCSLDNNEFLIGTGEHAHIVKIPTRVIDGYVYRDAPAQSWATIHDSAGNAANDFNQYLYGVYIYSSNPSTTWYDLFRTVILFDIKEIQSELPKYSKIIHATLSIYGSGKIDQLSITPNTNVYSSNPTSEGTLVPEDYNLEKWGTTPFCDTAITYNGWNINGYNDFLFNAAGIAFLQAAVDDDGIAKLGLRNAQYDVANSAPSTSTTFHQSYLEGYASEKGTGYKPKLVLNYIVVQQYTRSYTALLGLIASNQLYITRNRAHSALLGLKATSTKAIGITRADEALLGLKATASKIRTFTRSITALLGLKVTATRVWILVRSKTALLGLKPIVSRVITLARSNVSLLGLKVTATYSAGCEFIATVYLGLKVTASKSINFERINSALLGLEATATRVINLARTKTILLGLKSSYTKSISFTRVKTLYLGLKATATRILVLSRVKTALLGLKIIASGGGGAPGRQLVIKILTSQYRIVRIATSQYRKIKALILGE
jgi:photosystem II stability/assembly factor-like uncharacterized protein